jgi:hypothetical protein
MGVCIVVQQLILKKEFENITQEKEPSIQKLAGLSSWYGVESLRPTRML